MIEVVGDHERDRGKGGGRPGAAALACAPGAAAPAAQPGACWFRSRPGRGGDFLGDQLSTQSAPR
eukprot:355371-Chlamydomonas_euryale.AAC.2